MKLSAAIRYHLNDRKKAVIIFYLVMLALMVLVTGISISQHSPNTFRMTFYSMEAAATIFLFVLGLNSFKDPFLMMIQNGITRKDILLSNVTALTAVALGMTLVDQALYGVTNLIVSSTPVHYQAQIVNMFPALETYGSFSVLLHNILYYGAANIAAVLAGLLITTLFYRLNTVMKVVVPVGAMILLNSDWLFAALFGSDFMQKIVTFIGDMFFKTPVRSALCDLLLAVIAVLFTWLLTRRAQVKA